MTTNSHQLISGRRLTIDSIGYKTLSSVGYSADYHIPAPHATVTIDLSHSTVTISVRLSISSIDLIPYSPVPGSRFGES